MNDHPLRQVLHNEVHARPPEPMQGPLAISHFVMLADPAAAAASRAHLAALLRDLHLPVPDEHINHLRTDLGAYRLRWELHTEFVSWSFIRPLPEGTTPSQLPLSGGLDGVSQQWLSALPGECLSRSHLWLLPARSVDGLNPAQGLLREDSLVASTVADGLGEVFTDFQIHPDGFGRIILVAGSISARRQGRLVQQLLEIETYRLAAMLGLPAARQASRALADAERELASLALAIRNASASDEAALLDRLTRLAGEVEGQYAATHARFSATRAYFELIDRRVQEIAESRNAGQQTIAEFIQRRLTPARSTCEWAERRQNALSERVSHMSNLLRTRVDFEQQQSSQELLETMNRRQALQLKLQTTVEGLSVAAISYYLIGLLHYVAEGLEARHWISSPSLFTAIAVPLVVLTVWFLMRRVHHQVLKSVANRQSSGE
ncbi:MAG: DUF3422 domain-containing protein [Limnohabitans sp.]|jgi:uncharacterized membrane-anchored protein|nr:DUF3422 domain-containing protein [Limnohabitans sp.]